MALKRKLDKETFDNLPKDLQSEYVERDGEYLIDLDGGDEDSTGALRRAKDRAVQERKDAEKRAKDAEAKLAELDNNDARKSGDIEKLEKSWKDKLDAQKTESDKIIATKDNFISDMLIDSVARAMSDKISTSPVVLFPHIKSRLQADLTGDNPTTKYFDASGNLTTSTALEKEFVDNKDFASIIVASRATGGGAPDNGQKRLGGASQKPKENVLLHTMPHDQLVAYMSSRVKED